MSAFGIVEKKLISGRMVLMTVFSRTNYFVLSKRAFANPLTLASFLPRPHTLVHSLSKHPPNLKTRPAKIMQDLLDFDEPGKVSRIRLREDVRFSRRIGVEFGYLDFPDSKMRHNRPITDPSWPLENDDDTANRVYAAIRDVISRMKIDAIVSPWPYGPRQHVDHRLVSETAARVSADTGVRSLYVDDLPYSRRPLETMTDGRGRAYAPDVVKLDRAEMERKYSAMSLYRSQMIPEYFEGVCRPPPGSPGLAPSETLWRPTQEPGAQRTGLES
jgi:LmbE family N-acetylglucosaminyl deacetylase